MLKITISAMILTIAATVAGTAAEINETHNFPAQVSIGDLQCSMDMGVSSDKPVEQRLHASIGSRFDRVTIFKQGDETAGGKIELKHKVASTETCLVAELDEIKRKSIQRFGFVTAEITLVKKQGASFVNGFGECVALYDEEIAIQVSPTVILKSQEGQLRKMNDCAP